MIAWLNLSVSGVGGRRMGVRYLPVSRMSIRGMGVAEGQDWESWSAPEAF